MKNKKLVEKHMGWAFELARKKQQQLHVHIELCDLDSQALYGMVKAANRFDPKRGIAFSGFAKYFIVGTMEDFLSTQAQKPFGELLDVHFAEDRTEEHANHLKVSRRIRHAVRAIPERERLVIEMRFWEGASHQSIAARLGVNEGESWNIQQRAFVSLRKELARRGVRRVSDIL